MRVLITGGTRGIGNGLVKVFLEHGHQVIFTGTKEASIAKAVENLKGDYQAVVCDVRKRQDLVNLKNKAIEKYGEIDLWINNAGVGQDDLFFADMPEAEIRKVLETNVLGTMFGTSLAINQMRKQGHGMIYNFEGLGSNNMVIPKTIVYGSTKRLISYFTKGCQKELKREKNIMIGTIQPGMVFTDLLLENMSEEGMKIANILGNEVDYTARKIYKGIIKNKKKIKVLTGMKVGWKFFRSIFGGAKHHEKT